MDGSATDCHVFIHLEVLTSIAYCKRLRPELLEPGLAGLFGCARADVMPPGHLGAPGEPVTREVPK
jgi:hypothetical protein